MPTAPIFTEQLRAHPLDTWAGHLQLSVSGCWRPGPVLQLSYTLSGASVSSIVRPEPRPPGPADGLWRHTCFEAFVAAPGDGAYQEYNFSPSGQWAHYRFCAERVRDTAAEPTVGRLLPLSCTAQADGLQVQVELLIGDWPRGPAGWMLGLTAVLEHAGARLSHWALHHPCAQPDFHHPAGRVLRLAPPSG